MQTFLPYPDFTSSLMTLDQKRLGKQRVEAKQLLKSICRDDPSQIHNLVDGAEEKLMALGEIGSIFDLLGVNQGWVNHPARTMWLGYTASLALYHDASLQVWEGRGYVNNMPRLARPELAGAAPPPWVGDDRLHASHRSSLRRKKPEHYEKFGWDDDITLEYFWPSRHPEYA